jgi:hypothetical protein
MMDVEHSMLNIHRIPAFAIRRLRRTHPISPLMKLDEPRHLMKLIPQLGLRIGHQSTDTVCSFCRRKIHGSKISKRLLTRREV